MNCEYCDTELEEPEYGPMKCPECGLRHPDDKDLKRRNNHDFELRDVWVKVVMVGDYGDMREPCWDTEKEITLHWGEDTRVSNGDVYGNEHEWSMRKQDEISIFGAGIHGDLHGEMTFHAKKAQIEKHDDGYYVYLRDH